MLKIHLVNAPQSGLKPRAPQVSRKVKSVRVTQTETSGGRSETAVKEFAVSPAGRPVAGSTAVSATTPVANKPSTSRKCLVSRSGPRPAGGRVGLTAAGVDDSVIRRTARGFPFPA